MYCNIRMYSYLYHNQLQYVFVIFVCITNTNCHLRKIIETAVNVLVRTECSARGGQEYATSRPLRPRLLQRSPVRAVLLCTLYSVHL